MTMLDAALELASIGLRVFALGPRSKLPATPHGFKDASDDPSELRNQWRLSTNNVGLATGRLSGAFVLDVDGVDGAESLRALADGREAFPATPEVRTHRGRHVYFQHPEGLELSISAGKVAKGIDIRANGGYVVVPPSVHPDGTVYTWMTGRSPFDLPFAPAPTWLLELLTAEPPKPERKPYVPAHDVYGHTKYGRAALEAECVDLARYPEGGRNTRLNEVAFRVGQLVHAGHLQESMAEAEVLVAARSAGLDERESRQTFSSGFKAGIAKPNANDPDPNAPPPKRERVPTLRGLPSEAEPEQEPAAEPVKLILTADETAEAALIHLTDPSRAKMPRTGFPKLDDALGGFPPGTMTTIGGRTGAGKSSLMLGIAMNQAGPRGMGAKVGIISCEDSEWVWGVRIMASLRDVNPERFFKMPVDPELVGLSQLAIIEAKQYGIHLAFPIGKPLAYVLKLAREMIEARKCSVLMVDYLQAISATGQDRYTARTDAAQALKGLCHDNGVALIIASQLKRPETGSPFREPNSTDMKDSGDIENMSEAIMLLWPDNDEENATTIGKVSKVKWSSHRPRFSLQRNPKTGAVTGILDAPTKPAPKRRNGFQDDFE